MARIRHVGTQLSQLSKLECNMQHHAQQFISDAVLPELLPACRLLLPLPASALLPLAPPALLPASLPLRLRASSDFGPGGQGLPRVSARVVGISTRLHPLQSAQPGDVGWVQPKVGAALLQQLQVPAQQGGAGAGPFCDVSMGADPTLGVQGCAEVLALLPAATCRGHCPAHRCGGGRPSAIRRSSGLTNTTAGTGVSLPYGCTATSTGLQHMGAGVVVQYSLISPCQSRGGELLDTQQNRKLGFSCQAPN